MKKLFVLSMVLLLSACGKQLPDPRTEEPMYEVYAGELYAEFVADTLNAFNKYDDVVIQVQGLVDEVHVYDDYVTIDFTNDVQCKFNDHLDEIMFIDEYDVISVRGIVDNGHANTGVFLENCMYYNTYEDVELELTALEFETFSYEEYDLDDYRDNDFAEYLNRVYMLMDVTGAFQKRVGECIHLTLVEGYVESKAFCVRENSVMPVMFEGDMVTVRVFYYEYEAYNGTRSVYYSKYVTKVNDEEIDQIYSSQPK